MPYYIVRFTTDIETAKTPKEAVQMVCEDIANGEELYWELMNEKDELIKGINFRYKPSKTDIDNA